MNKKLNSNYLKFLSEEEIQTLHESTLEILDNIGIIIDNKELQGILTEEGAKVERETDIVKLPPELVEEAIERTPEEFSLYERGPGENEIKVGGGTLHSHTAGGPNNVRDLGAGSRRNATVDDVEKAARIVSTLENIHTFFPLVYPTDAFPGMEELEMADAAIRNTEKVIGVTANDGTEVEFLYEMFAAVAGSETKLKNKPQFRIAASPVSPLTYDKLSSSAFLNIAKRGLPTGVLPAPSTGATAPVTFAGALAQQNAELLAGLVILQTVNPGLPTELSPRLSIMDMRSSFLSWGTTELGMASSCAVQLLNRYGIPSDVYGLSTDAKVLDEQAGYEKAMNGLLPALSGGNFLSGAGSIESGKTASLSQLVIDDEILGMILDTAERFEINEDTIALDVIRSVGPKGDFLREKHTAKHTRQGEQFESELGCRKTWEEWVEGGKQDITQVASEKTKSILKETERVDMDQTKSKDLDKVLKDAKRYYDEKT